MIYINLIVIIIIVPEKKSRRHYLCTALVPLSDPLTLTTSFIINNFVSMFFYFLVVEVTACFDLSH